MTEIEALKKLARGIILAQGNIFIKELLRNNKIRIGTTKADFEKNLLAAIDEGKLTREHFDIWLNEVEGWGDQHVYLYDIPARIRNLPLWKNTKNVKKQVGNVGLGKKWNTSSSLAFPEKPELTGVYYDDRSFRLVWHERDFSWRRDEDRNYEKEEGLDIYQFRAYLKRAKRLLMRFEWQVDKDYAGLFVQLPWDMEKHKKAKNQVFQVLQKFMNVTIKNELPISNAIKNIDRLTIKALNKSITSQSAKLQAEGAYINFGSDIPDKSYSRVAAVRHVRSAVGTKDFRGEHGVFIFKSTDDMNISRTIKIDLRGRQKRLRFWHRCKREDVWAILNLIREHNN